MACGASAAAVVASGLLASTLTVTTLGVDSANVEPPWGPAFLECEGDEFEPEWSIFRRELSLKAPRVRGLGVDGEVVRLATKLLEAHGSLDNVQEQYMRFTERLAGASADEAPLDSFCLYGLVAARFVVGRHIEMVKTYEEVIDAGGDAAAATTAVAALVRDEDRRMSKPAKAELGNALLLLAKKSKYDFMESTRWPVRVLDLLLVLQSTDMRLFRYYTEEFQLPCHLRLGCEQTRRQAERNLRRHSNAEGVFRSIAAVGMHTTCTLEAVTALRDAAHEVAVAEFGSAPDVELRFGGHPCPTHEGSLHQCAMRCELLDACDESQDDALAEFIAFLVDVETFSEREYALTEAKDVFQALRPRLGKIASADMIVCTFPTVLCLLLHQAFPRTPLLYVAISNPLFAAPGCVWREDSTVRDCQNAEAQSFLDAFRTALVGRTDSSSEDGPGTSMFSGVAAYAVTAALVYFQAGVWLPLAGKAGRYVPSSATWGLQRPEEVLLTRSRFFDPSWGAHFLTVLRATVDLHKPPLTFVLQHEVGGLLSFEELASYRAAVILPQDLGLHKFTEHYAMAMPIWMPSRQWAYRLQMYVPWGMVSYSGSSTTGAGDQLTSPEDDADSKLGLHFPPWFCSQRSPLNQVAYWYAFAEFVAYPHVQFFDSVPGLLVDLLTLDLFAMSAGMRRFRKRLWQTTRSVYAGVAKSLQIAASAAAAAET
eukprot:TRINITY_DN19234_c0_g1_i1.p1 TRINITY_DN19234_c0_g1~~TRINITY_DN19234_c0_g1_i1.p1  ORF type:complete len:709 (+),score=94.07 TRINITY_DN19234_c0_g1_i1:38-2164(+)